MADITTQVTSSVGALMREFDIITHNLANVSTAGYKRQCTAFSKVLDARTEGFNQESPGGVEMTAEFDFSQGGEIYTGRSLDIALYGKGFLVVETPNGPLYTRHGVLQTNQNGQLVDSSGYLIAGQAGTIAIPRTVPLSEVNISVDGQISAQGAAMGKLRLVDFGDDENKLVPTGANCFRMPDENVDPAPAAELQVKQGYQESSNVKMVDELVGMIRVQRLYEANMKFIAANREAGSSLMDVAMG
jgi:flagellar basal-body rod protein FlgF